MESGPLLYDNDQYKDSIALHPRLWATLGFLYVLLGLTEVILAVLWKFVFGILAGLSLSKMGTTLIGIGVTGGRLAPLPPNASIGQLIKHIFRSIVFWGSSKFQQLFYYLRWLVVAFGVFVALLIAVRVYSPDPLINEFPSSCGDNRLGCSRVAIEKAQAPRGLDPLYAKSSVNATQVAIEGWLANQPGVTVLKSAPGFLHSRFITQFFGFADDFIISVRCDPKDSNSKLVVVEVQGQLRIGKSDLGVNRRRNQRFYSWLELQNLPEEDCV